MDTGSVYDISVMHDGPNVRYRLPSDYLFLDRSLYLFIRQGRFKRLSCIPLVRNGSHHSLVLNKDYYANDQPLSLCPCTCDHAHIHYHWFLRHVCRASPRSPHTRYVFWLKESPTYQYGDLRKYHNVFNWTFTYRLDSDIPQPWDQLARCAK